MATTTQTGILGQIIIMIILVNIEIMIIQHDCSLSLEKKALK